MFGFALKSTFVYMLWNKYKSQTISIVVSALLLVVIFSIYDDLFTIVKISNKENILLLFLSKWILLFAILIFNWYVFGKIHLKKPIEEKVFSQNNQTTTQNKEILNNKKLKTKSDVILQKYMDKDVD